MTATMDCAVDRSACPWDDGEPPVADTPQPAAPSRVWPDDFVDKAICGDSLAVMRELPKNSVDCVVTDPPYGLSNDGSLAGFRGGKPVEKNWKWDRFCDESYDALTDSYMSEISRVLKNGRIAYIWCGDLYAGVLARIGKRYGMKPKCILIAKKFNASPSWRKNNWRIIFETCLVMSKGALRLKHFNFLGHHEMANYMDGTAEPNGRDVYITECVFPVGDKETDHDCEKPVSVIRPLIEASTNPGDIVLDCFAGSGTTLVVSKLLGRHYIGIEREERWIKATRNRLAQDVLFPPEVLLGVTKKEERLLFDDSEDEGGDGPAPDAAGAASALDQRPDGRQEEQHGRDPDWQPAGDRPERQVPQVGEGGGTGVVGAVETAQPGQRVDVPDWLSD